MCTTRILEPPVILSKLGRAYWRKVAPTLYEAGVLTPASRDLVATMAENYAIWCQCVEALRQEGRVIITPSGIKKPHPLQASEKAAFDCLCRAYKELGISQGSQLAKPGDELQTFLDNYDDKGAS